MTGGISLFYLLSISNLSVIPASPSTFTRGRIAYLSLTCTLEATKASSSSSDIAAQSQRCADLTQNSEVTISGAFCCGFHSPFAANQPPPPWLARRWEKNLYSSSEFDIYFPWNNKRQVRNFSRLSQNISTYRTRKSKAHTMACTVEDIISPFKCSAFIEELH